jgi:hypothetical protein
MHSAECCRIPSEECRCLVPLAQSEAEATVLRSLSRSWVMIANQSDRYAEITKKPPAQKRRGPSVGEKLLKINAPCDLTEPCFLGPPRPQ